MRNVRRGIVGLAVALLFSTVAGTALAESVYMSNFRSQYPAAVSSKLDNCILCHPNYPGGGWARNNFGSDYGSNGHSYTAIEGTDSDGDKVSNIDEINALTFPGDINDFPPPPGDTTAPTVTGFTIPAHSSTLTVPILTFTADDGSGVTGYLVTESAASPGAANPGWSGNAPTSFTFVGEGAKTLYAWAKDAAGNVSTSLSDSVTVTLPPTGDNQSPTVTSFDLPPASNTLTVPVQAFTATDDTGVTGYLLTEAASVPDPSNPGWVSAAPGSYTFSAEGLQTLYAWARDAAGNVSTSLSDNVTITLPLPGSLLFQDDFADAGVTGDPDWEKVMGRFKGFAGTFQSMGKRKSVALVSGVAELDPYTGGRIETDVRLVRPARKSCADIIFDYLDEAHYRYARYNKKGRLTIGQVGEFGGETQGVKASVRLGTQFRPRRWHHLQVDVDGATGNVNVHIDGASVAALGYTFPISGIGRVGVGAVKAKKKVQLDNYQVWDSSVLP